MIRPEARSRAGVVPPASLAAGVTAEWRRAFRPPYEAPAVVAINGLLMTGAWFLLPPDWFFRVHTARVFPIILAVWMLADVPATNVLGSDPRRMSAVLDSPGDLPRMLTAKNLVLWLLVAPICVVVALVVAVLTQATLLSTMATIAAITIVPFGTLGVAAWLGILFPYHALPVRYRWQHRRPYGRMILRWALLVVIPYGLVPLIATVIILPVLSGWRLSSGSWATASDGAFALGVVIVAAVASAAWFGGHAVGTRLAARRAQALRGFLDDPLRG